MRVVLIGLILAGVGAAASASPPATDLRATFTGDTDDPEALLAARGLDVAFVSPWLLAAVGSQGRRIDARQVAVYHYKAGEAVPEIQGRLVPRPGDVLRFTKP